MATSLEQEDGSAHLAFSDDEGRHWNRVSGGDSLDEAYGLENIMAGNGSMPENLFVYPERAVHGNFAYVIAALVALHIGAALYHQFIRKDNLLSRMWYGK